MHINWKVRFRNPVFWLQAAAALFAPILAYFGLNWEAMTSWKMIGGLLVQAVQNPVVLAAMVVSLWNAINDPTTKGLSDSDQAMTYTYPAGDKKE